MSSSRIAFAFAAALVTAGATTAYAADASQTESGMRGFLTPQQRAMLMMENRGQYQNMSQDDRHAAREKMRSQWTAMSATDRDAKKAELQAKWDALPQAEKDKVNARIQERAAHRGEHGGDGQ